MRETVRHERRLLYRGPRIVLRLVVGVGLGAGVFAAAAYSLSSLLAANSTLRAQSPMQLDKKVAFAGPYGALANAPDGDDNPHMALLFEPKAQTAGDDATFKAGKLAPIGRMIVEHPRVESVQVASSVPLPPERPRSQPSAPQVAAVAPAAKPQQRVARAPSRNETAELLGVDNRTAIYDISARTVYLPSGRRLEAHSGLGDKMDDPRYVNVKMRGATPPNVYALSLREQLFHGERAIRLTPLDEGKMFGRAGILAHTYMLGPSGQSNGCVSFDNYPAFLNAFLKGEVERMVVVARLPNAPGRALMSMRDDRYAAHSY